MLCKYNFIVIFTSIFKLSINTDMDSAQTGYANTDNIFFKLKHVNSTQRL
jgi:hypothetical protein